SRRLSGFRSEWRKGVHGAVGFFTRQDHEDVGTALFGDDGAWCRDRRTHQVEPGGQVRELDGGVRSRQDGGGGGDRFAGRVDLAARLVEALVDFDLHGRRPCPGSAGSGAEGGGCIEVASTAIGYVDPLLTLPAFHGPG